jgi:hypothetical protein
LGNLSSLVQSIDFDAVARHHIHRVLLKIKTIASSGLLPEAFKSQTFAAFDDDTTTLLARLYKAQAVKASRDSLVTSFRDLIADSLPPKPPLDEDVPQDISQDPITTHSNVAKDEDKSPSVESRKISVSPSTSPEPFADLSDSDTQHAPNRKASAFLPSLSAVGYASGSESDASDVNSEIAPRRNRRGQRARRAIAEKKHGTKAKHLQTDGSSRGSGWDARRGAVAAAADRSSRAPRQPPAYATGANAIPKQAEPSMQIARERDDKGPIHASWAAKKQQKAAEKNSTQKFQGKRIVFD